MPLFTTMAAYGSMAILSFHENPKTFWAFLNYISVADGQVNIIMPTCVTSQGSLYKSSFLSHLGKPFLLCCLKWHLWVWGCTLRIIHTFLMTDFGHISLSLFRCLLIRFWCLLFIWKNSVSLTCEHAGCWLHVSVGKEGIHMHPLIIHPLIWLVSLCDWWWPK